LGALKAVLAAGPALQLALLFGSAARGRLHPGSDLDIGIIPENSDFSLRDELDLAAAVSRATGRDVDLVRLDRASTLVRWEVAKAHIPLIAGAPGALPRFLARAALDHADLAPLLAETSARLRLRLAAGT
jgi:predicted nucleotidyltransferase